VYPYFYKITEDNYHNIIIVTKVVKVKLYNIIIPTQKTLIEIGIKNND